MQIYRYSLYGGPLCRMQVHIVASTGRMQSFISHTLRCSLAEGRSQTEEAAHGLAQAGMHAASGQNSSAVLHVRLPDSCAQRTGIVVLPDCLYRTFTEPMTGEGSVQAFR